MILFPQVEGESPSKKNNLYHSRKTLYIKKKEKKKRFCSEIMFSTVWEKDHDHS